MKDTHFLYSIATLHSAASSQSLSVMPPVHFQCTHRTSTAVIAPAPAVFGLRADRHSPAKTASKNCGYCAERSPQELAAFRQRHEKLQKQATAYRKPAELIKQYGLEEGLRRIKQSDLEIATQLESFIQKHSVTP